MSTLPSVTKNNQENLATRWGLDESELPRLKKAHFFSRAEGMIPARFVGKPETVYVAITIADRLQADLLEVLNGLYIVHGSPGWKAEFLVSQAKKHKLIKTINYSVKKDQIEIKVVATAVDYDGQEYVGQEVSLEMARLEGWSKNPKYKSMPENMLKKRAATFLIRNYFPEVTAGMPTVEEQEDMIYAGQMPQKALAEKGPTEDLENLL